MLEVIPWTKMFLGAFLVRCVGIETGSLAGYRTYAAYKDGSVALSFESNGSGFVNTLKAGNPRFTYDAAQRTGRLYHVNGDLDKIVRQDQECNPDEYEEAVRVSDVAFSLNDNLGFRYDTKLQQPQILFAHKGIKHAVIGGHNAGTGTWDTYKDKCEAVAHILEKQAAQVRNSFLPREFKYT